ncbi:hypothetical protein COOONC_23459 [Cooperia oncophora]
MLDFLKDAALSSGAKLKNGAWKAKEAHVVYRRSDTLEENRQSREKAFVRVKVGKGKASQEQEAEEKGDAAEKKEPK